ncbi:MAG: hypothetical protein KJ714_09700 [Euryarchaeota archaeon]|nr:hypothetical protein [Euryarchaeota archaeon]
MSIEPIRRQSIVSLVWQIAFTFIGFLSTMYFAHAVGAGVLGAYFLFLAYYSIIGLMTDGGFGGAAIKRISEGEEPDAYFSAFVVLRSVFVTVVVVVLIAFRSYFVDFDNAGTFIWLLIALVMSLLQGAVSSGIVGRGKMGIFAKKVLLIMSHAFYAPVKRYSSGMYVHLAFAVGDAVFQKKCLRKMCNLEELFSRYLGC